jgi:lipid-binding SYLF domain-containing protein
MENGNKWLSRLAPVTLVALGLGQVACGGSGKDADDPSSKEPVPRVEHVDEAIAAFKAKDPSLETLFTKAAGYVIVPTVGEGAMIVGGARGTGEAFEGGAYVGMVTVTELSVGAQVGGQSFSQLVFFETPAHFKSLKEGTFEFGAEVSAVAATAGAAQTSAFKDGVAAFVLPKKGLMASAAIGGQKLSFTPAK